MADVPLNELESTKAKNKPITVGARLREERLSRGIKRSEIAIKLHITNHYVKCLEANNGPIVAVSDYVKLVAEQIAPYIDCPFISLGTDGFGRSETREKLRDFFEVNKYYIVLSTINLLYKNGILRKDSLNKAIKKYKIDINKPNPKSI